MGRQIGSGNGPAHPTGRPYQNPNLPPLVRDVDANSFLPTEQDKFLHGAADVDTPNPSSRTKGVQDIGDVPNTPSQPGHGDHTPSKGTP
jgi:hypothetical protein